MGDGVIRLLLCVVLCCVPLVMDAQRPLPVAIARIAARAAKPYPMDSAVQYGLDSIVLVFRDSTLTEEREAAGTWMFGPPVTKAEADGCPPEKVLGRRIAREVWAALGKPPTFGVAIVRIRGPRVDNGDESTELEWNFYYPRFQLTGRWVGDSIGAQPRSRRVSHR